MLLLSTTLLIYNTTYEPPRHKSNGSGSSGLPDSISNVEAQERRVPDSMDQYVSGHLSVSCFFLFFSWFSVQLSAIYIRPMGNNAQINRHAALFP